MEILAKEKVRTAWQSDTDNPVRVPKNFNISIADLH